MSAIKAETEFVDYVVELMQMVGPVIAKRMFGGSGLFLDGIMFALIADSNLYLKADAKSEDDFKVKGLEAFSYTNKGRLIKMSCFQAPPEILEDIEQMASWVNKAYETALRLKS